MLQHYRVLDLCQGISQFAGYMLASLGTEVISVEPPDGVQSRHINVPQSHRGTMWTQNCRTRMSRTPPVVWRGGPCLGEDNYEVLTEFLGYDADRIADLAAAEVLA